MKTFGNCEVTAGKITLTLVGGEAIYKLYGYAILDYEEDCIKLQPADLRKNPVMRIPREHIASLDIDLD